MGLKTCSCLQWVFKINMGMGDRAPYPRKAAFKAPIIKSTFQLKPSAPGAHHLPQPPVKTLLIPSQCWARPYLHQELMLHQVITVVKAGAGGAEPQLSGAALRGVYAALITVPSVGLVVPHHVALPQLHDTVGGGEVCV